jgi:hypothetical protein
MTQNSNILQELQELESSLAGKVPEQVYNVPGNYFENFPSLMIELVHAFEAEHATDEFLSPVLNSVTRRMPYHVPEGYFESFAEKMVSITGDTAKETVEEELETLSPLLNGISRKMPYRVPQGYFENIQPGKTDTGTAKIIPFRRRSNFRYAAAAVITALVVIGSFVIIKRSRPDPVNQPYAWVKKSIQKVDNSELDAFVNLSNEELLAQGTVAPVKTDELQELMKDVSDKEILDFINEIPENEINDDDALMN